MNYTVDLDEEAEAELRRLSPGPKSAVNRVLRRLRSGTDPKFDLRLKLEEDTWRALAGRRWRVVFSVMPGRHIQVRRIRRREDAYEGIEHPGHRDVREPESRYDPVEDSVPTATTDCANVPRSDSEESCVG